MIMTQTTPSVDSDGDAAGDNQHNLHLLYKPEYYVCYGRVSSSGGLVEVTHVQCIRDIALDQRASVMLTLPLRREIVLTGGGGFVGTVAMPPAGTPPQGCSSTRALYLCNNLNDLLDGNEAGIFAEF